MTTGRHWSDCAQHNMPAMPNGPCDCGADAPISEEPKGMIEVFLEASEVALIGNLLASLRTEVPEGLDPTFYHTLNYQDECKLKEKADDLAEKLGLD